MRGATVSSQAEIVLDDRFGGRSGRRVRPRSRFRSGGHRPLFARKGLRALTRRVSVVASAARRGRQRLPKIRRRAFGLPSASAHGAAQKLLLRRSSGGGRRGVTLGHRIAHVGPEGRRRIHDPSGELLVGTGDVLPKVKAGKTRAPAALACLGDLTEDALVRRARRRTQACPRPSITVIAPRASSYAPWLLGAGLNSGC
jgi:hypothetical protein